MDSDLSIEPVPAFADNYLWLFHRGGDAVVVDPGDAAPVLQRLQQRRLRLTGILVTHHHGDHVGGVIELVRASGARVWGPGGESIPARDVALSGGDRIDVLGVGFEVIDVPGHTRGHIAYFAPQPQWLFCGDTLFAAGCGRLFEGTAEQMTESLGRLAALPAQTKVFCAHEYTLSNLRFALAVEPGNEALRRRQQACAALRERGLPTLPSTIEDERATNPFLRCDVMEVRNAAQARSPTPLASPIDVFAVIRQWKNGF
jgi:hydroxyacylglutathione hydrolase